MGILLLISLMANKRCINSSPRTPPILGDRGTGFATRPRIGNNANKKENIEERESRSLETTRTPHDYGGGGGGGGGGGEGARCLGEARDQVRH